MADDPTSNTKTPTPPAPPPVLQTASIAAPGGEAKIKAMIAALSAEIEKVEGEASDFLERAKSHIANVWIHIDSHFTRARTIAAADAVKVETDAAALAAAAAAKV